ncbi:MAG TPA: IS256 family transposase, partial [Candidatus Limnocylindrales bacterium]|nr:IS256 family transposase [Candidatus Limnocylindrales bacterium]
YQSPAGWDHPEVIGQSLEELAREAIRRMLERALAAEVDAFLGRGRYERGARRRGYRNGYARPREIGVGTWSVPVRAPRVADVPLDEPAFRSRILPHRRFWSRTTQALFARLYLEGLSSGDFEPAFRSLVGERAPLSPNTVLRLKDEWQAEYQAWRRRPLPARYAYLWADGVYLDAGLEPETSCLLVVVGARQDGSKELLALELGYRESRESWAELLRGLRDRGLEAPRLAVGDGALGLWAALRDVYPETWHQRCWNHRVLNILDKLPERLWPEARRRLRRVYLASSRAACDAARDELLAWLRRLGQPAAADTLLRDWDDFVRFYDLPIEHWRHLRTSNPVESVFAGVRLRTRVAKRARRRDNALYLVFKIVQRLSDRWQPLAGRHLVELVVAGARFADGILSEAEPEKEVAAA